MRNTDLRLEPNPFPSAVLCISRLQIYHIPIFRVKQQRQEIQPVPFIAIPMFVTHVSRWVTEGGLAGWLSSLVMYGREAKE